MKVFSRSKEHHHRPSVYIDKHYGNDNRKNIRSIRKLVEFIDQRHSSISIVGLLLHTLMEGVSVSFYVWTSEVTQATNIWQFYWNVPVFIVEVVLNIIFFFEWVALFFFDGDKKSYLLSWRSFVNLLTSVPMIILGIGALCNSSWRGGWVPMYLRVWWLHDCLNLLLDYQQIAHLTVDVYREIARFFMKLFAIIITCVGTLQIVESCTGRYMNLYNAFYCMIVAFATIGFGDVSPLTSPARLFMIAFIIIGICYFVPLFQKLARISEKKQFYNYVSRWKACLTRRPRHVIICGLFSDLALELLLRNFYSGWRKYLNIRIVLMSSEAHTAEAKLTANLPWFKDRVMLLVGDPSKRHDLWRANAREADAIFLFGNSRSTAYYHDFNIIAQCIAVNLYDPELPQHVMVRSQGTFKHVAPFVSSALEIERCAHRLLGLSLVQPGVIPFFVNLLRTYEPLPLDTTLERHWVEQYEFSIRNDVHAIEVPDVLRGREFRTLARAYYERDVTLLGILNARNTVQLNPSQLLPNSKKLILIAKTMKIARDATQEIAKSYAETFGEEMLVAPDPDARVVELTEKGKASSTTAVGRARSQHPVNNVVTGTPNAPYGQRRNAKDAAMNEATRTGDDAEGSGEGNEGAFSSSSSSLSSLSSSSQMDYITEISDAFDMQGHIVIIELSSAKEKDKETRYAQEAAIAGVAQDIFNVIDPIRQADPTRNIVLLVSDLSFGPYFENKWAATNAQNPLRVIIGCGLNTSDLRLCNLEKCSGCCIFFAGDISRSGSTSGMAMLVDLSITEILKGPPPFPVVIELEGLSNLPLFPPYAEDERLRSKAETDFVFEPNFVIGNAMSRVMLYPALQRTYFMEEFMGVMNVLINGHSANSPAIFRMSLRLCAVELDTYQDVVSYCLKVGFLPVALHRRINDPHNRTIDGQRFVFTNPPHGLPVDQASDAVFYITSG